MVGGIVGALGTGDRRSRPVRVVVVGNPCRPSSKARLERRFRGCHGHFDSRRTFTTLANCTEVPTRCPLFKCYGRTVESLKVSEAHDRR